MPPLEGSAMSDDSNEEMVVVTRPSLKCPLTHQLFEDPVKKYNYHPTRFTCSPACGHVFSKQAILSIFQGGDHRCPVTGCSKLISRDRLVPDESTSRRIERQRNRIFELSAK